jgi:hypothetical protein
MEHGQWLKGDFELPTPNTTGEVKLAVYNGKIHMSFCGESITGLSFGHAEGLELLQAIMNKLESGNLKEMGYANNERSQ